MEKKRTYIAIDLKSFYASVECIERGLDPMNTNLLVADAGRTEKTIVLAVSPALKSFGIPGRPRLFEVTQKLRAINTERKKRAHGRALEPSCYLDAIRSNPNLSVDFIIAPPRMAHYIQYSTRIYQIYLKYVAPEDIHVYSIDEVFMDVTDYLKGYKMTARELTKTILADVLAQTGITATAGIGTNLYLAKVAMDIVAKHIPVDEHGARIAELDEMTYRKTLWSHRPLTDFWRVGQGYAKKLEAMGLYTMGDVARCSVGSPDGYYHEELLYKAFGVNAELLIDHAWGYEPCRISHIKAYKPSSNSICAGQVLKTPYTAERARLVVREMADQLSLDLVEKGLMTDQLVLTVGYDVDNLKGNTDYRGEVKLDRYGREIPKHAHGTQNLEKYTSSTKELVEAVERLYDRIINKKLLVRRFYLTAARVLDAEAEKAQRPYEQMDIFSILDEEKQQKQTVELEKERKIQHAVLDIKRKFGKNAIVKGMNLEEGATTMDRNGQIGGHKA